MRYTMILTIFTLMFAVLIPSAVADEDMEMMGERPGMHRDMGMGMRQAEQCMEPREMCWMDRPWDFWRHMDEGTMDMDAIHFMCGVHKIVILPFMDLTEPTLEGDSKLDEAGGPRRLVENLANAFMSRGYLVVPPSDAEAMFMEYMAGNGDVQTQAEQNNEYFFNSLPERSLDFVLEAVPGLAEQYGDDMTMFRCVMPEDIQVMGEFFQSDAVIRGFVTEYAVTTDIDADWRTLVPPFLGLLNPDKRVTIEVAYYLYDAHSGELIWNSTVEYRDDAPWPLFESQAELFRDAELGTSWGMAGRVLPNWMDLVYAHPEWVPFEMWYEFDGMHDGMGWYDRPDWLNPHRHGWHDVYYRHQFRIYNDVVDDPHTMYDDLPHSYNGLMRYYEEFKKD